MHATAAKKQPVAQPFTETKGGVQEQDWLVSLDWPEDTNVFANYPTFMRCDSRSIERLRATTHEARHDVRKRRRAHRMLTWCRNASGVICRIGLDIEAKKGWLCVAMSAILDDRMASQPR